MEVAVQNNKVFKLYLNLPTELQLMIIDDMESGDRSQFKLCSKLCNEEVKASKSYVYGLKLHAHYVNILKMDVLYSKSGNGYKLEFKNEEGKNYEIFRNLKNEEFRRTQLEKDVDLIQYGKEHFQRILQFYQNGIKKLTISGEDFDMDSRIRNLNDLEELEVKGRFDILKMFSKLRNPLKKLYVDGRENSEILVNCEEMYQVQNELTIYQVQLNSEQFTRLSAYNVNMSIGSLTEQDICNFITSWINGTLGKEIGVYKWRIFGSDFDIRQLMSLLEIRISRANVCIFRIKHATDAEKYGRLRCNRYEISFSDLKNDV